MKWLFLLLLIANVAFFSWSFYSEQQFVATAKVQPVEPPAANQLQLLSELTRDEMPPLRDQAGKVEEKQPVIEEVEVAEPADVVEVPVPEEAPIVETPPEPPKICFRVTNIGDKKVLQSLLKIVGQGKGEVVSQGESEIPKKKYWVMLPPYKSRTAANNALAQIKKTRVKDYFRIRSGDYVNAISLGVFSTMQAAKRRVSSVKKPLARIGRSRIEVVDYSVTRPWILFSAEADRDEAAWRKSMKKAGTFKLSGDTCPADNR